MRYYDSNYVQWDATTAVDPFQYAVGKGIYLADGAIHDETTMNSKIIKFEILTDPTPNPQAPFYSQAQVLRVFGNDAALAGQDEWERFLLSVIPSYSMANHTFDYQKAAFPITASYALFEMKNNISFYEYERKTKAISTKVLPNFSLSQYFENAYLNEKSRVFDYLNFSGAIDISYSSINRDWYVNYYNKYTENIKKILENSAENLNKNYNLFILNEYNSSNEENVPYCGKFSLYADDLSSDPFLTNALRDTRKIKNIFQFLKKEEGLPLKFTDSSGVEAAYKTYDLMSWFSNHGAELFSESNDELFMFPEDEQGVESAMSSTLYSLMLLAKLRNESKTKIRDAEALLNFDPCKSEIIGFKIEKYLNSPRGNPDQVIYIKGSSSTLIDTQMKFDENYFYHIYALVCVVGTQYRYTDLKHSSADGFITNSTRTPTVAVGGQDTYDAFYSAEITMISEPSLQIVEVPFMFSEHTVVGIPPHRPEYKFSNESNKPNELNILLSNSSNEEDEVEYPTIGSDDEDNLQKILSSQSYWMSEGKVLVSYKYNCGKFEIYRSDTKPTKLSDFVGKKLTTIQKKVEYLNISTGDYDPDYNSGYSRSKHTCAAAYKDFLLPNRKYYYLFKALTEHNLPSPPSEILEVEIIQDSDESRVVVNPYVIEATKNESYKTNMKRFMQIMPNSLQVEMNHDLMGTADSAELVSPHLGTLPKSLWDKKFKIRLTSKHTGKKIDINIVFKINEA